jgi:hypothetical protein
VADNKNQHYVPRCHLRPFTKEGGGRAINIYNLDSRRAIECAPVKNQCSGDYFYGNDKRLDGAIQFVEDHYGVVVNNLLRDRESFSKADALILRRFILLQHLRTEAASRRSAEMVGALLSPPGTQSNVTDFKNEMQTAIFTAMQIYAENMKIIDDLNVRILFNNTRMPFVTSDDPSILTNKLFLQNSSTYYPTFGAGSSGAIFILPLSPNYCCILFDGDVYSIPHAGGFMSSVSEKDVVAINEHQIISCFANIYFKDWDQRDLISSYAEKSSERRLNTSNESRYAVLDGDYKGGKSYTQISEIDAQNTQGEMLVHVIGTHPVPTIWPSFLKYRSDRRVGYSNGNGRFKRRWCVENGFVSGSGYRRVKL